ncbi:MAG TPA: DUF433 domain-containing protein [Candidatus Kapabacteria bacterium]|jgi:uncharacterized protein (DUF433 family)
MAKPRIISDPDLMVGKPTIEGTRLTVELILEELAAGRTVEEMLYSYPRLTRDGINAALEYALGVLRMDEVFPVFLKAA